MDSRRNELKVGIAVFVSIVILIGGIMWGKGYRLRVVRYPIEVVFSNVGGLEPGSNVLVNGVVKGRVSQVELREGKVIVRASVDKSVSLYADYRITIESPTVMAGKVLAIFPGGQPPLVDVSVPLRGHSPMGVGEAVAIFESVSSDLQIALRNINSLVVNLNRVAGDTANQQNLANLLDNANGVAKESRDWIASNRDELTSSLVRLNATLESAEHVIQSVESRLNTTMSGVDSAVVQMSSLSAALHELVDRLQSDQSTVGKLLTDDELYRRLNGVLAEVDSLAQAIRTKGLQHRIVLF